MATRRAFARLIEALPVAGVDRTLLRLMLLGSLNATQTWLKRGKGRAGAAEIAGQFIATLRQGAAKRGSER